MLEYTGDDAAGWGALRSKASVRHGCTACTAASSMPVGFPTDPMHLESRKPAITSWSRPAAARYSLLVLGTPPFMVYRQLKRPPGP
jgi:hypothetical protein